MNDLKTKEIVMILFLAVVFLAGGAIWWQENKHVIPEVRHSENQIPSDVLQKIKAKYAREYPDDYTIQKVLIDLEVQSYIELNRGK